MLTCDVCGAKDAPQPPKHRPTVVRSALRIATAIRGNQGIGGERPVEEKTTPLDLCARCHKDVAAKAQEEVGAAVERVKAWMVEQAGRFADAAASATDDGKDVAADETLSP